ncbi:MAG: SIS domain-containing protein [Lachnospiraceae bacterium]|nr:SIS domain-containing protein [Lachnospiraceae bacterium]
MDKQKIIQILDELVTRYPILQENRQNIYDAYKILEECYVNGHKLLVVGNGGSAADAEHIVGELMKGFVKERKINQEFIDKMISLDKTKGNYMADKLQGTLPALSLNVNIGLNTAYLNDVEGNLVLAQEVYGYGKPGDVFMGISTSGNSVNINYAVIVARAKGLKCIALSGKDGGELKNRVDTAIIVKEKETFKIQELHLPIYHALCLMLEERFFV